MSNDIDDLKRRAGITEATEMNYFGSKADELIQRMQAEMDVVAERIERLRKTSYQETGVGGREHDQGALNNIKQLERQLEGYDAAIDAIQTASQPESPKNW
jgi:AcrR family transcriptional regulator